MKTVVYLRKLVENFFKYKQLGNTSMAAIKNLKHDVEQHT